MNSRNLFHRLLGLCLAMCLAPVANASYIIEIDTDGADDGVVTYNPNFSFGGDTTNASQSALSTAAGMSGGDSIFGGDGYNEPDTYVFSYDLDVDLDNLVFTAGTALNGDGDTASGQAAGATGTYRVYSTWPHTTNVSGGLTHFQLSDDLNNTLFDISLDQNNQGNDWIFLGSALLDAARTYTLTQSSTTNSFVSMRAAGVLFDFIGEATRAPEPPALALLAMGMLGLTLVRRRRGIADGH